MLYLRFFPFPFTAGLGEQSTAFLVPQLYFQRRSPMLTDFGGRSVNGCRAVVASFLFMAVLG